MEKKTGIDDGDLGTIWVTVLVLIFLGIWIAGGSFWVAAFATLIVGGFFAAVITGVIAVFINIVSCIFTRNGSN